MGTRAKVGDKVKGIFRNAEGDAVAFTGRVIQFVGGWTDIAFDAPVAFRANDLRADATFAPRERDQWEVAS